MERLIKGNSRGMMFTLVTVVVVVLLLGEVLTYLYTNTQYNNLGVQQAPSVAASAMYSQIELGMPAFLTTSLGNAAYALGAYESLGSGRVTDGAAALESLMYNGTLNGTDMSGIMGGYTVAGYANVLNTEARSKGLRVSISGANIVVFQSSAGQVSASLAAELNVSSQYGRDDYPMAANASVPLSALPGLFALGVGSASYAPSTNGAVSNASAPLIAGSIYAQGNAIANALTANAAGSRSGYLFAVGPLFVDNSLVALCNDGIANTVVGPSNYILVTPNAVGINSDLCGYAGLVTYLANSTAAPVKPYLVYNSVATSNIIGYLRTGGRYILDGNTFSIYEPSALQDAVYSGAYFESGFAPSYLDLIGGPQGYASPFGAAPFSAATRMAASFSGSANMVVANVPVNAVAGGVNTASFWMQWPGGSGGIVPFSFGAYSIYVTDTAIGFSTGGGNLLGATTYGAAEFTQTPWVHIVAEFGNGIPSPSNDVLYIDGVRQNLQDLAGSFSSPVTGGSTISIGGFSDAPYAEFNGMIADVQVYNSSLTPYQAYGLYASGINGAPMDYNSLVGWWPLNGNFNDFSTYHGGWIRTGQIPFAGLSGYWGDSLDGGSFSGGPVSAVQGISQCYSIGACAWNGAGKVYIPVQQDYMNRQQPAGSSLGLANNTVPGAAYFNAPQNSVLVGSGPFNNVPGQYDTVSFWMEWVPNGVTGTPFYFSNFGLAGDGSCFGLSALNGGSVTIKGVDATTVGGRWVNIVATLGNAADPSAGASLYVNGVSQALGCGSSSLSAGSNLPGSSAYIGAMPTVRTPFPGAISDVQVYNVLLTPTQVGELYLNNSVPGVSPAGWWPLNAGNEGLTNQSKALAGGTAYEVTDGNVCTEANSLGFGNACGIMFLPSGPV